MGNFRFKDNRRVTYLMKKTLFLIFIIFICLPVTASAELKENPKAAFVRPDSDIILSKVILGKKQKPVINHFYTIKIDGNEIFASTSEFKWSSKRCFLQPII